MRKQLLTAFIAVVTVCSIFTSTGLAKNPHERELLVALGDSITFGFDPRRNNDQPSKQAFPNFIDNDGKKDFDVTNLGIPSWTSAQLLDALQNNETFRNAIRHADVVTLNIGSNDLLNAIEANALTPEVILIMLTNITNIVQEVQLLAPDAKIVVYNIYYPLRPDDPRFGTGLPELIQINGAISQIVTNLENPNIVLADAFSAIGANPKLFIIPGDVHPTVQGHKALANAAEIALYGCVLP